MWRTTDEIEAWQTKNSVSIHVPRVEDDTVNGFTIERLSVSIHVPRVEDDQMPKYTAIAVQVSIHVPRVEDDVKANCQSWTARCFNPRPPCGGRPRLGRWCILGLKVSIHVPRVEDDFLYQLIAASQLRFQSTSPVWRTTLDSAGATGEDAGFNPRPPCGGRPAAL